MKKFRLSLALCLGIAGSLIACSNSSDSASSGVGALAFRPPVAEVAGTQLATSSVSTTAVSASNFKDRFFGPGPTNILNILLNLDQRMAGISAAKAAKCMSNTPTQVAITVFGQSFTLQLQCYDTLDGTGLITFGKKDDSWYVFEKIGAGAVAAKATPLTGGKFAVEIFGSIGLGNGTDWSSGSYGGFHLVADTSTHKLEMTTGGIGFGFCGAYLNSDGTNIYLRGSEDGIGQACQASANLCVLNSAIGSAGSCGALLEGTFSLTALGRAATTNYGGQAVDVSAYPASPPLILNGLSTDSVHFGPTVPADLPNTITSL